MAEVDRLEVIIEAEAKKANAELDRLIGKLNQVSSAMSRATGFNMSGGSANINNTTNSLNTYTKATTNAIRGTHSLTMQVSRLALAFFTVRRAITGIGKSIESSMDFTETVNLFQTSFKKIGMESATKNGYKWGSESADAYAKGFIDRAQNFNTMITDSLGLDPNTMMNYQAIFAQMSNSMGLTADTAMNISESFTMLGSDISSLWNKDIDQSMKKLQGGLAGQIRPLRELGFDISQTSLEMTALNYGIEDNISDMSQAAKVQLRWLSIMDQAEVAFGDMAKTINSPANQLRILSQQWTNLTRSIGNVFLPVVTTILPYINALVIALRRMIDVLATAVGFELPDYKDTDIYTSAIEDIGGVYSDLEDTIGDTTEANEKLKKSIAGFDELNILSENRGSKSKAIGGAGSGYKELDDAIRKKTASYMAKFNEELSKMSNMSKNISDDIVKFFKNVAKEAKPATDALKKLYDEGLSKLAKFAFNNLKSFYNDFLVPVGRWILGEGLPRLFNTINNLLNAINWDKLNRAFSNFYDALAPFAINVGVGLISFIESLVEMLTPVLSKAMDLFAGALNLIAEGIRLIPVDVAIALGGAIGGVATAFLIFKTATAIGGIIDTIKKAFSGLLITLSAHPLLALATGIAALAGAMMAVSKAEFDSSDIGKYAKEVKKLADESESLSAEIDELLKKHDERKADIEAEYGAISILADNYFDLADKQRLTNEEQLLLKSYAAELIKKIPELSELIDEQTGAYKGTKEEINELISRTKEYYLVQAAQESLIEIAKAQYKAEKLLSDELKKREEIQQYLNKVQSEYNDKMRIANEATGEATLKQKDAHREAGELWKEIQNLNEQLNTIDGSIKTTKDDQSKLNNEWTYATDYILTYSSTAKKELPNVESAVNNSLSNISKAISNFKLPNLKVGIDVDTSNVARYGNGFLTSPTMTKYATGGMPEPGEVFQARENGMPELVGRIGRRTTVMNNSQIVESVSGGVASAIANVLAPILGNMGSGTTKVVLEGGAQEIFNVVRTESEDYRERTGKNPFGY